MNQIISGNCINLYYKNGNTWQKIAHSTVFGLSITLNYNQTKSKDDDDDFYGAKPQNLTWSLEGESLVVDDDEDLLFDIITNRTKLFIGFGVISEGQTSPPQYGYMGYCWLTDLKVDAPTGEKATYAYTLEGCSALEYGEIVPPDPTQPIVFNDKDTPTLEFEDTQVEHELADDYILPDLVNPLDLPVRFNLIKLLSE